MLEGKVAIITGASRGIGKATAVKLAEKGTKVVINYFKNENLAISTLEEIHHIGGTGIICCADVTDVNQVSQMIEKIVTTFGKLDIIVNNAGSIERPSHWRGISDDIWKRALDINLKGAFNVIRAGIEHISDSDSASIINIASTFGYVIGSPGVIAYGAAKAGIVSLTRSFAKELGPKVRVNCVAPGIIDTDMTSGSPPKFVEAQINATPLKRIGTPEDVADAVIFFASPMSRFITGQVMVVDGGHSLR